MNRTKIIIAENHAILRDGLKSLLATSSQLEIIAEAQDGKSAIKLSRKLSPDLILMDLNMPNINGTEAMQTILSENPKIKIIALTGHKSEEYVWVALEAGAVGYVLKDDTHGVLLTAIEQVMNGHTYLSPGICDKVLQGYIKPDIHSDTSDRSWFNLTKREREVTKLIAEGKKSREVAEYLSISLKTVEKHRSNLMKNSIYTVFPK
ncbi:MAG: response regulator transcription factor [Enterobacterales bacterium]|nr:response regulator transcription factor [Enterobacterales bacterium]